MPIFQIFRLLFQTLRLAFNNKEDLAHLKSFVTGSKSVPSFDDAYQRGDYVKAFELAEDYKSHGKKTAHFCYYRGSTAFQLGRFEESEQYLREALEFEQDPQLKALVHEQLGLTLHAQGRFEEAIAANEAAIALWPERGCGHRGIAAAMLCSGTNPGVALTRAKQAVEVDRSTEQLSQEAYKTNISESLAILAWAVGSTDGSEWDIDKITAESLGLWGKNTTPALAQIHCHVAQGYMAVGKELKAMQHFEQAATLDPNGYYGRLAKANEPHIEQ